MKYYDKKQVINISSRTRSSNSSDSSMSETNSLKNTQRNSGDSNKSIKSWKISEDMPLMKIPLKPVRKSTLIRNKNKLFAEISDRLEKSKSRFKDILDELNFLQGGNLLTAFKKATPDNQESEPNDVNNNDDKKTCKEYFLSDDSDDSDSEYLECHEIMNRVKAERKIIDRIDELRSDDMWSQKIFNRKSEPRIPGFHWDSLIKEMKWYQSNVSVDKQNKKVDARKIALAAAKYVKEKEAKQTKLTKEDTIKAKKHCLLVSKIIKDWWKQMDKIVLAKHKFRLDARRQEAMNTHLDKVLETTEKYTEWLTEDLKTGLTSAENDTATSDDDPEFKMNENVHSDEDDDSIEDEITDAEQKDELALLAKDNEQSLGDILDSLPVDYVDRITGEEQHQTEVKGNKKENYALAMEEGQGYEYRAEENAESSDDNEETLDEEEKQQEENDEANNEIAELADEAELPIEELLEKYRVLYEKSDTDKQQPESIDVDDEEDDDDDEESEFSESSKESSSSVESVNLQDALQIKPESPKKQEKSDFQGQFEQITEVAESTQPRGFTLDSADVHVQVPFLLKGNLREYQHVGLDWLAAIYEKRLNGVLADEMGLGKTIQTIALLAYLACDKGIWGPHLIIVPTSVMLNWELELKKWCPSFKILTYFGSVKDRKEKRRGWTKPNAFHICITSYKLAIQDSGAFKRKKWKYVILDEAQNIKNFKSQRWQTLLTFNSQRRLLLTGTPLQNNLMELWSLMHFLMPNIFQSHREFNEWFGNPLAGMIEGNDDYNEQLVIRLHKVLRPFILRRLKKDVEKQLPQKQEHVVMCPLSKRQRFLYDDFMSMTSTKESLSSGQYMSIISILMQLRKVCNHPNLFEERPIVSPFSLLDAPIRYRYPRCLIIEDLHVSASSLVTGSLVQMATDMTRFVTERICDLQPRTRMIEEVDSIQTTDWVTLFKQKYGASETESVFLPPDINVLLSSQDHLTAIEPPQPVLFGLKTRNNTEPVHQMPPGLPGPIRRRRREQRRQQLCFIAAQNTLKCCRHVGSITADLVEAVRLDSDKSLWQQVTATQLLLGPSLVDKLTDTLDMIKRATCVTPAVLSSGVQLYSDSAVLRQQQVLSGVCYRQLLHDLPPAASQVRQHQLVQFPQTRLIEYDCGKLQVLVQLLQRLRTGGHRCLIFTQMTRMLDILEQFLSYHGHRYLRLDGTTKVEQRQLLMECFNKDDKIFAFILSTRSGGIGVNLTGADTVIFYDSDWNPTMDAQAQDRCHRIGQTRDVHIYRLISSMTVEENILKKANEKRYLAEMAIEGGQFNMAYFKSHNTLTDIFQDPSGLNDDTDTTDSAAAVNPIYRSRSGRTVKLTCEARRLLPSVEIQPNQQGATEKGSMDEAEIEAALDQAEEDCDRIAAKLSRAEARAELAEFDESVPWNNDDPDNNDGATADKSIRNEMELHLENFNSQLDPIQRFGVTWLEQFHEEELGTELQHEETQIETNKQEWELDQIKALHETEETARELEEDDMLYIHGDYDPSAAQKQELQRLRWEEELEMLRQREEQDEKEAVALSLAESRRRLQHQKQHQQLLECRRQEREASDNRQKRSYQDSSIHNDGDDNDWSQIVSPKQRKTIVARLEVPDDEQNECTASTSLSNFNANSTSYTDYQPHSLPPPSSPAPSSTTQEILLPKRRAGRPSTKAPVTNIPSLFPASVQNSDPDAVITAGSSQPLPKRPVGRPRLCVANSSGDSNYSSNENVDPSDDLDFCGDQVNLTSLLKNPRHTSNKSSSIDSNSNANRTIGNRCSSRSVARSQARFAAARPRPADEYEATSAKQIRPSHSEFRAQPTQGVHAAIPRYNPQQYPLSPPSVQPLLPPPPSINSSFKIPVKNLSGEHKLFSAPKLLQKANPVFLVTRKIEDQHGNVYMQNLTYPVNVTDRYQQISQGLITNFSDPVLAQQPLQPPPNVASATIVPSTSATSKSNSTAGRRSSGKLG